MRWKPFIPLFLLPLLVPGLTLHAATHPPPACDCQGEGTFCIDLANNIGVGEEVRGPVCIWIENINRLRYDVSFDGEIDHRPGIDFRDSGLAFPIPSSAAAKSSTSSGATTSSSPPPAASTSSQTGAVVFHSVSEVQADQVRELQVRLQEFSSQSPQSSIQMLKTLEDGASPDWEMIMASGEELRDLRFQVPLGSTSRVLELQEQVRDLAVEAKVLEFERAYASLSERKKALLNRVSDVDQVALTAERFLEDLVAESDSFLRRSDVTGLIEQVKSGLGQIEAALAAHETAAEVPTNAKELLGEVRDLQEEVDRLPRAVENFGGWHRETENAKRYDKLLEELRDFAADVEAMGSDSKPSQQLKGRLVRLGRWRVILTGLQNEEDYRQVVPVDCSYPFNVNKEVKLKVLRLDRLGDAKQASTSELLTVVCPNGFTMSTGILVSGLAERSFAVVESKRLDTDPGEGDTINKIGFDKRSDEQLNAVLLVNARLHQGRTTGLYASVGPVLELNNANSGVQLGIAAGLSLAIREHFLLTAGVHLGRTQTLNGGFEVGDPIGDLPKPPTEETWKVDWALMFTYKVN